MTLSGNATLGFVYDFRRMYGGLSLATRLMACMITIGLSDLGAFTTKLRILTPISLFCTAQWHSPASGWRGLLAYLGGGRSELASHPHSRISPTSTTKSDTLDQPH